MPSGVVVVGLLLAIPFGVITSVQPLDVATAVGIPGLLGGAGNREVGIVMKAVLSASAAAISAFCAAK